VKWIENKTRVKIDEFILTLVDFWKMGYQEEPFIMTYQASQVFYIKDPMLENWSTVLHGKINIMTMKMNNPIMRLERWNDL